ncbi:MAG: Tab2/Atab2 family RNA-binding protein [Hormoscilla sp. SP5CHS1]|nr:Tab2/Atab2 family RNA-binding protein [Hormoscilla sp. SP12CHS1]MBC6454211.1 Tab2/Atab2 family RNA-binding protein [Hormoscilla sp. SP5CHS1]
MGIIWELDFYSRPILDEKNKKIWEVILCESPLNIHRESLFQYSQYCSSKEVNSVKLRQVLEEAISQAGKAPSQIRFFRRQMKNMITKACQELDIQAVPSRRTIALNQLLEERSKEVYPQETGYDPQAVPSARAGPPTLRSYQPPIPQRLPDALMPKQWAFVSLTAGDLQEMSEWDISFGEAFPMPQEVTAETPIPGVILFSPRALPMAGWMSGIELAFLKFIPESPAKLILETGASDSWILANLKNKQLITEAAGFESAKQEAQQIHFLAVQSDPQSQSFAGFWLLQELHAQGTLR